MNIVETAASLDAALKTATGDEWDVISEVIRTRWAEYSAKYPDSVGRIMVSRKDNSIAYTDFHKVEVSQDKLLVTNMDVVREYPVRDACDEKGNLTISITLKKPLGA